MTKEVPLKMKGKFYKIVMRPVMMSKSEGWTLNKKEKIKMKITRLISLS